MPLFLIFRISPQSESAPSPIWPWRTGRFSSRVGTSPLWTEPGWISDVTLTSILWAAPGASVVRASGALPSRSARVRDWPPACRRGRLRRTGAGREGRTGKDGELCEMGGCGGLEVRTQLCFPSPLRPPSAAPVPTLPTLGLLSSISLFSYPLPAPKSSHGLFLFESRPLLTFLRLEYSSLP